MIELFGEQVSLLLAGLLVLTLIVALLDLALAAGRLKIGPTPSGT